MITGSIVAIVTPMHEDGSLDYPRLRSLVGLAHQAGHGWHRDRRHDG